MGMLSRAVRLSLVWTATVLTPVAGAPRIDCLCPNGHVKLFCLRFTARSGECCGGCCTKQSAGHRNQARACCHRPHAGTRTGKPTAGTTCRKTLAEPDLQTTPSVQTPGPDHGPAALVIALLLPPAGPCAAPGGPLAWPDDRPPPPTDRVIAFQHLLI